jgi:hypothetical protein
MWSGGYREGIIEHTCHIVERNWDFKLKYRCRAKLSENFYESTLSQDSRKFPEAKLTPAIEISMNT